MNLWKLEKLNLWIKLDGDELYQEFQRIYDEGVGRVLIKKRWKIKCGIWAEKDDFSSYSINIDWIWSDGLWIEKINLRLN